MLGGGAGRAGGPGAQKRPACWFDVLEAFVDTKIKKKIRREEKESEGKTRGRPKQDQKSSK